MSNEDVIKKIRGMEDRWPIVQEFPVNVDGWFLPCNAELCSQFLSPNTRCVLELGSWLGMSTRWLLDYASNAHVIAIDHWRGSPENQNNSVVQTVYERFLSNCKQYNDRLTPLRMSTQEGIELLQREGLRPDMVFIDAGHDYDSAKADIRACLRFNCPLVGDDFNPYDWLGVTKAVWEVAKDNNFTVKFKFKAWSIDPRST